MEESLFVLRRENYTSQICVEFPSFLYDEPISYIKSIVKRINLLRRTFLWNGNKEQKSYNLVKWDTVTLHKKQGGISIRNPTSKSRLLQNGYGGSVLRICLYGKKSSLRNMDFKVTGSLKTSLVLLVVMSGKLFGDSGPSFKKMFNSRSR